MCARRAQRLRIRWEPHETGEVRVAAARGPSCAVGLGGQEAEKMQNESLRRKTDGVSGHASILTSCATSRWAEDGRLPVKELHLIKGST